MSDDFQMQQLYTENEELRRVFKDHQTRTAKRICELELNLQRVQALNLRLAVERATLDSGRRDEFTKAALTGLCAYSGTGTDGYNAVRLADEALAALATNP